MTGRKTTLLLCFLSALLGAVVAGGGGAALAGAVKKLLNGDRTIAPHTLSGNRLRANTLGGAQINESSLRTVPRARHAVDADHSASAGTATMATSADTAKNATTAGHATSADTATTADSASHAGTADTSTHAGSADDAGTVGGLRVRRFRLSVPEATGQAPVFTAASLTISAGCDNSGVPIGTIEHAAGSTFEGQVTRDNPFGTALLVHKSGGSLSLTQGGSNGFGSLTYQANDGTVTSIDYQFDQISVNGTPTCTFSGTAVGG